MDRPPVTGPMRARRRLSPKAGREIAIWANVVLMGCGLFVVLIAGSVYFEQRVEFGVRATVNSEKCHHQVDPATGPETRCDLSVSFITRKGAHIRTSVGGALPSEIHRIDGQETIQLLYDPSTPYSPDKGSNYLSLPGIIAILIAGLFASGAGVWQLKKAHRLPKVSASDAFIAEPADDHR